MRTLGMTQAELHRRADIPQSTLNSILQRDTRSTPYLIRLATVLRTSPAYLAGETDDDSEDANISAFTMEEMGWVETLNRLARREREALLLLAESLAGAPKRPTVHSSQTEYRAG